MDNYYSKEDKILLANILDKYHIYLKSGKSTYSNFLNATQVRMIIQYLNHKKIPYSIYQPYSFLEKQVIYFGEYNDFVTFYRMNVNNVSHSQILGTLFSLGLDDSLIGDIFVEDDCVYYTNLTRMNSFLESHFIMIKNQLITLAKVDKIVLTKSHFQMLEILVSSMRIDNVVSKLTNKSRSQVNQMFLNKQILLNYNEVKNSNIVIKENDILSIRKYGKYKIGTNLAYTKKGNIVLEIIKYI